MRRSLTAVLVVLGLVSAACGSSAKLPTGAGAAPESAAAAPTTAPAADAAKAWVADVNARGGLGGHKIRFVDIDDGGDSNRALAAAKQLVEQEHAAAIYGERAVTTLPAITKYLETKNVPVVGDAGNSP